MRAALIREFERSGDPRKSLVMGDAAIEKFLLPLRRDKEYVITSDGKIQFTRLSNFTDQTLRFRNPPDYVVYDFSNFLFDKNLILYVSWDLIERGIDPKKLSPDNLVSFLTNKLFWFLIEEDLSVEHPKIKEIYQELMAADPEWLKHPRVESLFKNYQQILLLLKKQFRTPEEKERQEFYNFYLFVGRPAYREIRRGKKIYHEKYLEIENLVQTDIYDESDLNNLPGMKMRATSQGEGSRVYGVYVPVFMHNEKYAYDKNISDELREYIEENKFSV